MIFFESCLVERNPEPTWTPAALCNYFNPANPKQANSYLRITHKDGERLVLTGVDKQIAQVMADRTVKAIEGISMIFNRILSAQNLCVSEIKYKKFAYYISSENETNVLRIEPEEGTFVDIYVHPIPITLALVDLGTIVAAKKELSIRPHQQLIFKAVAQDIKAIKDSVSAGYVVELVEQVAKGMNTSIQWCWKNAISTAEYKSKVVVETSDELGTFSVRSPLGFTLSHIEEIDWEPLIDNDWDDTISELGEDEVAEVSDRSRSDSDAVSVSSTDSFEASKTTLEGAKSFKVS